MEAFVLVLHFVLTVCRPIIVFYSSLRAYLDQLLYSLAVTELVNGDSLFVSQSLPAGSKAETFAEFVSCALMSVSSLATSFSSEYKDECLGTVTDQLFGLPVPDAIFATSLNCTGFVIVALFVVVLLWELSQVRKLSIGSGHYIAFTFRVQTTVGYRFMSAALICFSGLCLLHVLTMIYCRYRAHGISRAVAFAQNLAPTIGGLVYSAVSLMMLTKAPMFEPQSEKFKSLQFNRPIKDILVHNEEFAKEIESSMLDAKYGSEKELAAMLAKKFAWQPEASSIDEVMIGCAPKVAEMGDVTYSALPSDEPDDGQGGSEDQSGWKCCNA
eukprot:TRINITY_DN108683_c0_g1_i1.p1 TRINITY_DN108683_c0_g1~~TRINITY_DN108683_c0_g1_i1.p1  ORF type:complete len:340 (-),score=37.98 TRINITY_DN108683_c0_g1_i1:342-1322(-)